MNKNTILYLLLFLVCAGCEDYLEVQDLDEYSETSVFKTEKDISFALNNLYTFLPAPDVESSNPEIRPFVWTDDAVFRSVNGNVQGADLGWTENSGFLGTFYRYSAIRDINEFLARIPEATFTNEEKREQFTMEARFLRALIYERMVFAYGDVPLITEPTAPDFFPSRTPRLEVFNFVITELDAIGDLPKKSEYSADDAGRITRGAVLALKARAYLNALGWHTDKNAMYAGAEAACRAIVDGGEYDLEDGIAGFEKQFTSAGDQNSTETVLANIYVPEFRTHTLGRRVAPKGSYTGPEGPSTNQSRVGYTASLIESFQTTNGLFPKDDDTYDPANPWENRDPRLKASAFLPGDILPARGTGELVYEFQPHPSINPSGKTDNITGRVNPSGYNFKKYVDYDLARIDQNDADYKVIRYSEVLLMLAEALAGQDKDNEALPFLNEVRERVGMPAYTSANLPVVTKGSTGNAMIDAILLERRYEFAGEGAQRWTDIWRYKLGDALLNGMTYGIPKSTTEPGDLVGAKYSIYEKTWDDKFYLLPMPLSALDANDNLTQNPGWN
ncbi:RagB/SusD family nutrient uptake outer membrane protein [Puteibacter caeruleilacunae]|nr:RagB/SusD family nutrient uptake outer membrane protein [Puteibacter caeruleilacunae]